MVDAIRLDYSSAGPSWERTDEDAISVILRATRAAFAGFHAA